jgi:hypothetical protein
MFSDNSFAKQWILHMQHMHNAYATYTYCICNIVDNLPSLNQTNQPDIWSQPTEPMYFVFCRLYPSSLQPTRVCAKLLSVISLNLTNTVSPVRACLSKWLERFRGSQKEDERGARIYRPSFRENKPKTLVFSHRKRAFWACFRENWVYIFGHRSVTVVCKFLDGLNTLVLAQYHLGSIPCGPRSRSDDKPNCKSCLSSVSSSASTVSVSVFVAF